MTVNACGRSAADSRDVACNVRTAGSKLQFVTFCDLLYQFYEAEVNVSSV
ncbi:MAG: hypothetical protein F6K22_20675 [Okeania sp. SIO2F4]|nr:hypothetical protein [Okeania sp. SIO2F4]NES05030.1 hypothetical protein [Okeania sp. SIO2F4]